MTIGFGLPSQVGPASHQTCTSRSLLETLQTDPHGDTEVYLKIMQQKTGSKQLNPHFMTSILKLTQMGKEQELFQMKLMDPTHGGKRSQ